MQLFKRSCVLSGLQVTNPIQKKEKVVKDSDIHTKGKIFSYFQSSLLCDDKGNKNSASSQNMQEKVIWAQVKPDCLFKTLSLPLFKEDLISINNLDNETALVVVRVTRL